MRIQKFLFQNLGVVQGVVNTKSYLFSVLNSLVLYLSLQYNKKKYMRCTVFWFFWLKHTYNGQITQWSGVWIKIIGNSSWLAGCPWNYWYFSSNTSVIYGDMCFHIFMLLKFDHCDYCNFKFFLWFFHTYKLWWLNTYNGGKIPLWKPCTLTKLQIAAHFSKNKVW